MLSAFGATVGSARSGSISVGATWVPRGRVEVDDCLRDGCGGQGDVVLAAFGGGAGGAVGVAVENLPPLVLLDPQALREARGVDDGGVVVAGGTGFLDEVGLKG